MLSIEKMRKRLNNMLEGLSEKYLDTEIIINKVSSYA